ncbi:transposase [Actinacidiphila sp. bgisy160]|uniref:transposase n=1 Tax=Actinacidiphila sp. bgisy160 TaxID=3413796 RepID=UPI003D71C823
MTDIGDQGLRSRKDDVHHGEHGEKKPRPRRSFTPEFKAEIVELCRRGDRSVGQVAKDFDLTETAVRDWEANRSHSEEQTQQERSALAQRAGSEPDQPNCEAKTH